MRYVKIFAALSLAICLTSCGKPEEQVNTETPPQTLNASDIAEKNCPFGDISGDKLLLLSSAYAPSLLKTEEDTVKTLANAFISSEWEIIDNETSLPDGENFSVFVYNDGQPFKLTFYGDYTSDEYDIAEYEQNGIVKKYRISHNAYIAVFNEANPKAPVTDNLISREYENLSADGVWPDN